VSIGQILLFAWPIGIYFVTSDVMDEDAWTRRFTRLVLLLALPQVVMLAVPASTAYLFWSTYFGVIAAPLAVARATVEPTRWKKLVLAMYLVPPLVQGVVTGKAFLYGYILVSTGIIVLVRARRLVWLGVPAIGLVAGLVALAPDAVSLPGPLKSLVQKEEEQKSWGGRAGRGQLTEDALEIWSNYPMLGVGPANSYAYMVRYSVIGTPHNQYAGILLECGVVGLVIVLAFVVGVLRFGWAAIHQSRDLEAQNFLLAWFGSFAALALVSTSGDYMLHSVRNGGIPMFAAFYIHWVFLGAAVGLARHGSRVRVAVAAPGMAAAPLTWMAARVRRPISAAGSR
jgi:O-antigen ligase